MPKEKIIKVINKRFNLKDSINFSKISGDFNSIHIDKEYARKSMTGKPVIHGVHLITWGINEFLKINSKKIKILLTEVIFNRFALIDTIITLKIIKIRKNKIKFQFFNNRELLTNFTINFDKTIFKNRNKKSNLTDVFSSYVPDKIIRIDKKLYKEKFVFKKQILKKHFLHIFKYLDLKQIIDLFTITRFIGMKVPGLNSILYKITLNNLEKSSVNGNFKVTYFDKRFKLVKLTYKGLSFYGKIEALIRPTIKKEVLNNKILKIKKKQFSKQRALIVGGSRGLGESTAKILSKGFAKVLLSYYLGKNDALKIKNYSNKRINIFYIDIKKHLTKKQKDIIKKFKPTHFYYFATPKIFVGEALNFDIKKFNLFTEYYINGFHKVFEILDKENLKVVFSPSSVSVKEPTGKLFEYSCSKSAMETYFYYLQSKYSDINFYYPRMSKIRTNQTISIFSEKIKSPYTELMKQLNRLD